MSAIPGMGCARCGNSSHTTSHCRWPISAVLGKKVEPAAPAPAREQWVPHTPGLEISTTTGKVRTVPARCGFCMDANPKCFYCYTSTPRKGPR